MILVHILLLLKIGSASAQDWTGKIIKNEGLSILRNGMNYEMKVFDNAESRTSRAWHMSEDKKRVALIATSKVAFKFDYNVTKDSIIEFTSSGKESSMLCLQFKDREEMCYSNSKRRHTIWRVGAKKSGQAKKLLIRNRYGESSFGHFKVYETLSSNLFHGCLARKNLKSNLLSVSSAANVKSTFYSCRRQCLQEGYDSFSLTQDKEQSKQCSCIRLKEKRVNLSLFHFQSTNCDCTAQSTGSSSVCVYHTQRKAHSSGSNYLHTKKEINYERINDSASHLSPTLEESLLSDKLFGSSSTTCSNYIPEDGEYSFSFDLSSLEYFDDSSADIEEVMFQVQMSHTDSNSNRTWSIKVASGGNIYSYQGKFGESIPPNVREGKQFVDEVNQKVCVDVVKKNDPDGRKYFVHQAGPYQDGDVGYTDEMPYWFSPNLAIYCSTVIPECRLASWGQQSLPRKWSERIIYYDRYRDCGDGIMERTHIIHNAEIESTDTVLSFVNMPWGGTKYTTLKDFLISQNSEIWDYDQYNLTGGIEDPMLVFGYDSAYGIDRVIPTPWTKGYTIFTQDLPFVEHPSAPSFIFPGRLPADSNQPILVAADDYGAQNRTWICQGPLPAFSPTEEGNYRCRMRNVGYEMRKGCNQCHLRFTNSNGSNFKVSNVRHWLYWDNNMHVSLLYFNTNEMLQKINEVMINGSTITVSWEERGKRADDNLALSFVHGRSEKMIEDGYINSRIRFGHSNNVQQDFAVFEYISNPYLSFGSSYRARQYYITDRFTGLSDRSEGLATDTIEEVIPWGEFESSQIYLHYINDGSSTTFGNSIDDSHCNNQRTTIVACIGTSTPQIGKNAFLQIECGASTYVGTDFYYFSRFPTTPYRVMNCTVNGETTSIRPSVKLLGYFDEDECGTRLQNKTYDASFCSNQQIS